LRKEKERMIVRFWGVRGSLPAPGPHTVHFGGNTSCVEVRCGDQVLILDGGTGLRGLGERLRQEGVRKGIFLFSHVHWDHIQGFPFFVPAYDPQASFEILGGVELVGSLEEALHRQMRPPNFPVRLREMGAGFTFGSIQPDEPLARGEVGIQVLRLRHPDPSFAYRIQWHGASVVYATDTEHPPDGVDGSLVEFARNVDLLIYDAQFTPEEYEGAIDGRPRRGWGHSTAQEGARVALASHARQLILFHHDPTHDDDKIRSIEREIRALFPNTMAAFEGLVLQLGEGSS
jgi:phosphoribosyl 1,2-cyclic phosphodiesterase